MDSEPAAIIGTITAIVSAFLTFAQEFGIDITDGQQDAIRGIVGVLAPLIAALVIRSFVVAPDTAEAKVEEAHASGVVGGPVPSVQV